MIHAYTAARSGLTPSLALRRFPAPRFTLLKRSSPSEPKIKKKCHFMSTTITTFRHWITIRNDALLVQRLNIICMKGLQCFLLVSLDRSAVLIMCWATHYSLNSIPSESIFFGDILVAQCCNVAVWTPHSLRLFLLYCYTIICPNGVYSFRFEVVKKDPTPPLMMKTNKIIAKVDPPWNKTFWAAVSICSPRDLCPPKYVLVVLSVIKI